MSFRHLTRSASTGAAALAVALISIAVPAPAHAAPSTPPGSSKAAAALMCDIWRSGGAGLTAFGRCTQANGYPKFQVRVTCANGTYAYSPAVPLGQTTWATCTSRQGGAGAISILGKN